MERRTREQVEDEDNGKDSIVVGSDSSQCLSKRLKLEDIDDVSVSGKEKVTSTNALLIDLVLANVISYLENSSPRCIKDLRRVCKLWDREIKETLRKKTEIDVIRLVAPYPEGLGWTAEGSGENGEPGYTYQCPYPVEPNSENLKVIGTCEALKNVDVIHWFETMGSNVKSLHFHSSLTCYHQTRFLECVLKRWCNNLSRLYLDGFTWNRRFSASSGFNNDPFLMNQLKEIIVNGESNSKKGSGRDCARGLEGTYLNYAQSESNEDIVDINMESSDNSCGVWENILCNVGSEKLLIKNLPYKYGNSYCKQLFPTSVMSNKQVKLVETLKHFEYQNFLFFHDHTDLIHFAEIRFPITKLCFGPLPFSLDDGSSVTSLLESLSVTLQHLEFQGNVFREQTRRAASGTVVVLIPPLPRLKFFKNGNISIIQTGSLDFLKNLPSLETCSLQNGISAGQFRTIKSLFETVNFKMDEKHENLKKLELIGKITHRRHIEQLEDWFPNLKTLEVMLEGKDAFYGCTYWNKKWELEEIKISFYANNSLNSYIISYLCDMQNLRFLELVYLTDNPCKISLSNCQNGFAKAPKLTSLKLKNVCMFVEERERIMEVLSHISYVSLTNCVFQLRPGPTNMEFSIGNDVKFPAIDWNITE